MNNVAYQLMLLPKCDEVDLLLGTDYSFEIVKDIIDKNNIKNLNILVEDYLLENKIINDIEDNKTIYGTKIQFIKKQRKEYKCSVLVFLGIKNYEIILEYLKWKPDFLLGEIKGNSTSAFSLWEAYREVSSGIYIISYRDKDTNDEVLNWQKSKETDIELAVIIPVDKSEINIAECIKMVSKWDVPYVRYYFVDNGLTDNCVKIIKDFRNKDQRIILLTEEKTRSASKKWLDIDQTKSRYISFIEPKDIVDPLIYKKLLSKAIVGTYDITFCGQKKELETTESLKFVQNKLDNELINGTIDYNMILDSLLYLDIDVGKAIYKRELFDNNNLYFNSDSLKTDDLPFKFKTFACAKSVAYIPEIKATRQEERTSLNDESLFVYFEIFNHLDEFIRENKSRKLYDYLQCVKLQTHISALTVIKSELRKEYVKKAKKDLLKNMNERQSKYVFQNKLPKKASLFFKAIMHENILLIDFLLKH